MTYDELVVACAGFYGVAPRLFRGMPEPVLEAAYLVARRWWAPLDSDQAEG